MDGELLIQAHGLAVTWDGAGRYTVWNWHPAGRWVENHVWQGPRDPGEAEHAAAGLLAERLKARSRGPLLWQ